MEATTDAGLHAALRRSEESMRKGDDKAAALELLHIAPNRDIRQRLLPYVTQSAEKMTRVAYNSISLSLKAAVLHGNELKRAAEQKADRPPSLTRKRKREAPDPIRRAPPETKADKPAKVPVHHQINFNSRQRKQPKRVSRDKYDLVINNHVFTARFNQQLDLRLVARAFPGSYQEHGFPAAVLRLACPSATINFFALGTLVISGAASPEEAAIVAWMLCAKLTRLSGKPYRVHCLEVQNIVGSFALGVPINRDLLLNDFQECAVYDPNAISHVSLKPFGKVAPLKPMFLVYQSGKCVVTGAIHPRQLQIACDNMAPFWHKYELGKEYRKLAPEFIQTRNKKVSGKRAGKADADPVAELFEEEDLSLLESNI